MPIVHMLGMVFPPPPYVSVTFTDLPKVTYKPAELDLEMTITINITNSDIDIACDLNNFQHGHIGHIHKISLDLARATVNLASFLKGYGLTAYLHTLVLPNGTRTVLLPQNPQLESICTAFSFGPAHGERGTNSRKGGGSSVW